MRLVPSLTKSNFTSKALAYAVPAKSLKAGLFGFSPLNMLGENR